MGVVWRASQVDPVEREVALKIIKLGMDSRAMVARFESERQALAVLDHPHISTIFDAGTTGSGRPYYVMELLDGLPITDYCAAHHVSVEGRLELFGHICQAVQFAHGKGIIHRDLKPSNVLVEDHVEARLKIIDFGVAKASEPAVGQETICTREGQIVGTPGYMSPEQAGGGEIDERSDVYSLGALLYELLSGTPPFANDVLHGAGLLEMLRVIREEPPARPSARGEGGEVPKELDWIALKALEKAPERRYESAAEIVAEIDRFLSGEEEVRARSPGVGRRLRHYLRRHPRVGRGLAAGILVTGAAAASLAAFELFGDRGTAEPRPEESGSKGAEHAGFRRIEGRYERIPVESEFHMGWIMRNVDDTYSWRLSTGAFWVLELDPGAKQLRPPTGSRYPMLGETDTFELLLDDAGAVVGFNLNSDLYRRAGD